MSSTGQAGGPFERVPPHWLVLWIILASLAGLGLSTAVLGGLITQGLSSSWHQGFAILACVLLLPVPFFSLRELCAQGRVWHGRVAPLAVWQRELRRHQRLLLIIWAFAAVPMMVLRLAAPPPVQETWAEAMLAALWPAVMLAGLMGLVLLAAATAEGVLGKLWGLLAAGAMAALLLPGSERLPFVAPTAVAGSEQWVNTVLLVLVVCLGPLASRYVHQRLAQAPDFRANPLGPLAQLGQAWAQFTERWRLVDGRANMAMVIWMSQLPGNLSKPNADAHFLQAWGSTVTPLHGLRLLLLTLMATLFLRGALLHWRVLLAPGSHFRRYVGLRVVGSTLGFLLAYLALYMAVFGLVFTLLPFQPAVPLQHLPALAFSHGLPLLADVVLAVALAAWLRGALGSQERVLLSLMGLAVLTAVVVFLWPWLLSSKTALDTVLWTRGVAHHAGQFALAAVFILFAQAAWSRADLGVINRRQQPLQAGTD